MRLRSQFLISLLVFALVTAAIVSSILIVDLNIADMGSDGYIAEDAEVDAGILGNACIDYFLSNQQNLSDWQARIASLNNEISSLNSTRPQQQRLVDKMFLDLQTVNRTFNDAAAALKRSPLNETSDVSEFEAVWSRVDGQIEQLTLDTGQLAMWLEQQENSANQTNLLLITVLIASFVVYFLLVYQLIFKRVMQPVDGLNEKMKDLTGSPQKFSNEIGELSTRFEQIEHNLKQTAASKQALETEIFDLKKAEADLLDVQSQLQVYADNLEKTVDERTAKIRESEQSYRELYESFGEAFIATDWNLNIMHWNRAAEKMTAVKAKDAVGKNVAEVLPEMRTIDAAPYLELLRNKQPARFMLNTLSRLTGREAVFEVSMYPATQGIIVIVEDKTEEEQTKRLSAIGQTAGMVGHDIRNPLQAITSDLYLLQEELKETPECAENPEVKESFATIEENIFYINKIISDLQDYTRPLSPVIKQACLKDVLEDVLVTVKIPKTIETKMDAEQDLTVNTDAEYLKRILSNLVTNAVQAMPNGGELTLKAHRKHDKVHISVKDTGVGMGKETKGKIFTPLFTTKAKGQGLGLAVVKRLVNILKGEISYISEEGKGTEFTIELPIDS